MTLRAPARRSKATSARLASRRGTYSASLHQSAAPRVVREQLAPPVEIEIVCRTPDPVRYGRYLMDVYIRRPDATDWTDLGATLLATGHAVPYPSSP